MQFAGILNSIVMLKNMYDISIDDVNRQMYESQILSLESKIIQHDFALLKL